MSDRIVVFEETGEERIVRSLCGRCVNAHWVPLSIEDADIVSRNGIGHLSAGTSGDTICGIDATGQAWWWHRA